jgi:hypothetical protein
LKTIWRRKKKKKVNDNNKPQQKSKHGLQQVANYQPGDSLKEGTHIHRFAGPAKGVKKSEEASHINRDSLPLSVLMFCKEIFDLLFVQINVY